MNRKLTDPQSAQWGAFWNVTQQDGGSLVCGAVNAKNTMGGYIGMTGLTYEPKLDRAIMLFSGRTDGDAGIPNRQRWDGKRSVAEWPKLPRPSSTLPNRSFMCYRFV
jgi:hypothetical protein